MEQLVNFIIRPPRAEYDPKHDLLDQEFMLRGKWFQRKDVEIKNSRGDVLQCTHYVPIVSPEEKPLPCVIYCHGNSGCRADASEAAIILLPSNITVFTLDFSGSGISGGEHVTLGWYEKDDLKAVVDYLRQDGNVSLIGLWGRSMGAVTSLMYGAEDPSIAGMVLDSPFSDLVDLMMELVDTYKFRFPKFTVKFAIQYMKRAIQKKAKFDITGLNTLKVAQSCFVPALFGHAIDDDFIQPHHSDRIYEAYMGDKNIIKFEGDHNSPRPQFYFDSINIFFHNVLHPPEDPVGQTYFDPMTDYFSKHSWRTRHDVGNHLDFSVVSKGPSSSNGEEASKQVRPKRPMSRMEVPSDIPSNSNQSEAEAGEVPDKHLPSSSSDMISFELSDGNPYGPHVPMATEDDRYVEYQLDDLSGFPCDVEEEERMLMEAVIASLKDLETRPKAEEQQPSVDSTSNNDSQKECNVSETAKELQSSKTESTSSPLSNGRISAMEHSSPDPSVSAGTSFDSSPAMAGSGSATTSSPSDTSGSVQSSTDTDLSSNTKATLTVERNPASHIMDGLLRKWDFNLFRNNR
ncbi:alpha/beta-Hydrolases superfamily protein [Euphorbia peplus]|nr:alpha/beta-Hydrolases superfamily protein [Euphorbia peplus]